MTLTTSFDRILASSPVDVTAARVTSRGETFETKRKISQVHSEVPLPMKRFTGPHDQNLTGHKFGRFTVIGYAAEQGAENQKRARGSIWVVRCVCGRYATRRTRAVKNPINAGDRCEECRATELIQNRGRSERTAA